MSATKEFRSSIPNFNQHSTIKVQKQISNDRHTDRNCEQKQLFEIEEQVNSVTEYLKNYDAQNKLKYNSSSSQGYSKGLQKLQTGLTLQQYQKKKEIIKNFENGVLHGQVNIETNLIEGEGVFFWNNGDIYGGQWQNNEMNGLGIYISHNGSIYKGSFQQGQVHGKGQLLYPDSTVEEGLWHNGKLLSNSFNKEFKDKIDDSFQNKLNQNKNKILEAKQDFDQFLQENLQIFKIEGQFIKVGKTNEEGQLEGICAYIDVQDTKLYYGLFKQGKLNGRGRILFKSGDIYDGFFQSNQFSGPGIYYNMEDNVSYYGYFNNNQVGEIFEQMNVYPPKTILQIREKQTVILDEQTIFRKKAKKGTEQQNQIKQDIFQNEVQQKINKIVKQLQEQKIRKQSFCLGSCQDQNSIQENLQKQRNLINQQVQQNHGGGLSKTPMITKSYKEARRISKQYQSEQLNLLQQQYQKFQKYKSNTTSKDSLEPKKIIPKKTTTTKQNIENKAVQQQTNINAGYLGKKKRSEPEINSAQKNTNQAKIDTESSPSKQRQRSLRGGKSCEIIKRPINDFNSQFFHSPKNMFCNPKSIQGKNVGGGGYIGKAQTNVLRLSSNSINNNPIQTKRNLKQNMINSSSSKYGTYQKQNIVVYK